MSRTPARKRGEDGRLLPLDEARPDRQDGSDGLEEGEGCSSGPITLEVGDQVVVVEVMGSGQRSILRCEAANTAAGTSTILAK